MMIKNNFKETFSRFDSWWNKKPGMVLIVADLIRPGPVFADTREFTDNALSHKKYLQYLKSGAFYGDVIPDMSSYLGPGSLCTFIGAEPIYTDKTIWYKEGCKTSEEVFNNCRSFLSDSDYPAKQWYDWSLNTSEYIKEHSDNEYMTSIPDLQQNLDIIAAVMGADKLFMEMIDQPEGIHELLEILYCIWEIAYNTHYEICRNDNGYSSFTHYNIAGKGKTSVLQSDISCMMSPDMFDEFELPYLKKQCELLDNIIYHLDGPGALQHIDSILSIDQINAVQWVPGAGNPPNADECWYYLYDKITKKDKGLYVFLQPDEIEGFLKKYHGHRILIRTLARSEEEQIRLVNKYSE